MKQCSHYYETVNNSRTDCIGGRFCRDNPVIPEKFKRKLTAILSTDVRGYSRLMGADEEATLRTLQEYKEVMASSIQHHRGRWKYSLIAQIIANKLHWEKQPRLF
jgi:class 3 adenylate cyclase